MSVKTKTSLILDLIIFVALLVVASPNMTGMAIHEWLALALAAAIVAHLLFHWKWIVSVSKKFFAKLFHESRLNYVVNLAFFVLMTASMFSGLLISKSILDFFGIHLNVGRTWQMIHKLTSDWALIALGLHFALHVKWLVFNLKRYLFDPVTKGLRRRQPQPHGQLAAQPIRTD